MDKKKCSKCKDDKLLDDFPKDRTKYDGYDTYCKKCKYEKIRKNYEDPKKKKHHRKTTRKWNDDPKNYEKRCSYHRKYGAKSRLIPHKRLARNLSSYLWMCISRQGIMPWQKKTLKIIGMESWNHFVKYIESTWTEGMTWDNWGLGINNKTWHIDHKIPVNEAKNQDEVKQLFHYTNLRAMWGSDNIRKRNKITY